MYAKITNQKLKTIMYQVLTRSIVSYTCEKRSSIKKVSYICEQYIKKKILAQKEYRN